MSASLTESEVDSTGGAVFEKLDGRRMITEYQDGQGVWHVVEFHCADDPLESVIRLHPSN